MAVLKFLLGCFKLITTGSKAYKAWVVFLLGLIAVGIHGYAHQFSHGLISTAMRDQVSWGFYIGNFTFLVGVAAAAVMLVIPAYVYHWEPIKEVVILGELLAISAITMCLCFVMADMGHPERLWEFIPYLGSINFPRSLLAWDSMVLNAYLVLNLLVVGHLLFKAFMGQHYNKKIVYPLVLLSIPAAVSIHTVTAFLYNGLIARPFWNAAILAPRFIASAFCSGPAILLILFQVLRKTTPFRIKNEAIWKVAELMAYAMFFNLFLEAAEVFKEYYSDTEHLLYMRYLFTGVHGHNTLVPYAWTALGCNILAFLIFLHPKTRRNFVTLNLGCLLIYSGVYIEKGMGLVIPGMTPDTLGEIYEYSPTITELKVAAGVFALGFLVFTLLVKIAVPIVMGQFGINNVRTSRDEALAHSPAPASH